MSLKLPNQTLQLKLMQPSKAILSVTAAIFNLLGLQLTSSPQINLRVCVCVCVRASVCRITS